MANPTRMKKGGRFFSTFRNIYCWIGDRWHVIMVLTLQYLFIPFQFDENDGSHAGSSFRNQAENRRTDLLEKINKDFEKGIRHWTP